MRFGRTWAPSEPHGALHIFLLYLVFFLAVPPVSGGEEFEMLPGPEQAADTSAVVYLIDESSSMFWIFDELRESLRVTARNSKPGDCLSIFLFGDRVTHLASYKSIDQSEKEVVDEVMESVYPNAFHTNLVQAVKEGTESLYKFYLAGAADDYTLVLVTDGKNNPSPDYIQDYTFEEALTQFPDFYPGKHWSLKYIALESQVDPELLAVVKKYGESFFDAQTIARAVNSTQEQVVESILENPLAWKPFGVQVADLSGEIKVKKRFEETWTTLSEGSRIKLFPRDTIAVGPESRAALNFGTIGRVGLNEHTEVRILNLQKMPMNESVGIKLELERGAVWIAVEVPKNVQLDFELITPTAVTVIRGTVLMVQFDDTTQEQNIAVVEGRVETRCGDREPGFETFALKGGKYCEILPGQKPSPPEPIPDGILVEWSRWMKALILKLPFSRINFETVLVTPCLDKIALGPMRTYEEPNEVVPLAFSQEYFGDEPISARPEIRLPPGLEITTEVEDVEDEILLKNMSVSAKRLYKFKYAGVDAFEGKIRLECASADISFSRDSVGLDVLIEPPSSFSLLRYLSNRMRVAIIVVSVLLGLIGISRIPRVKHKLRQWKQWAYTYVRSRLVKTRLVHLLRSRPSGQIVLRSAPFISERYVFDLADISRETNQIMLRIGNDAADSIVLPHPSIRRHHCIIWASRRRNPTKVFVERLSEGHLAINGVQAEEFRRLRHKDIIDIGECQFQFMDSQYYRQIMVRMNNGVVHRGKLEYWDLSQGIFYMADDSGSDEGFFSIRFAEVSYVHFYRDKSERHFRDPKAKRRKAVTITLARGKSLQGYVDRKYKYARSSGIFLYPGGESTDIQYTYIPKSSIESLLMMERPRRKRHKDIHHP